MYMHIVKGPIYETQSSELWKSVDNGNSWTKACDWPGSAWYYEFQQKTYAAASDGCCYALTMIFSREIQSGLLLLRVPQSKVEDPNAYVPWGFFQGNWGWGYDPTTIATPRRFGEICFRQIGSQFVLTFFDDSPADGSPAQIKAQLLPSPTSNVFFDY